MNVTIAEKIRRVPKRPGVYLLKDARGKILYVGKARMLASRLRSHFHPGRDEERRHALMMARVADFETIVTDSEVEALILEANFVKEHRPRYNVNLKDDKSYPYIRVTAETFPRVFVTRKIVRDGSRYYGPYTDVQTLRRIMAAIRRIFTIRTCKLQITDESIRDRRHSVCLMYHIGRCGGPCEGHVAKQEYGRAVERVVRFIEGKNTDLVNDLTERMTQLAAKERFEEAAVVRDQIRYVEHFQRRQKVVDARATDRDILAVASEGRDACGVVFTVRDGKMINRQHFYLAGTEEKTSREIMNAFLEQYYLRTDFVPPEIFLSEPPTDEAGIACWLGRRRGRPVTLHIPKRGDKARLMDMCRKNTRLLLDELCQQRSARAPRISAAVEALQRDLGLPNPPIRIEAFDNSNTQGGDPVAAMVVFENGKPRKSEYRKYKVKTVRGIDDYASMAEIVERRIGRLVREGGRMPDLILVDGGKGQLSAATGVLGKFALEDLPVVGLAKHLEEIYRPGIADPQTLPRSSPGLRLLQQVRDEAHRFAVSYHRSLRSKRTVRSKLDDIPGIGEKRRKALLRAFGSLEGVRNASPDALARVDGMNRKAAGTVFSYLNQK
ncbi:MAG TPA: excinuclease ABC subunit C [bacterium]|mgnify:CR=1 FL=1|nr:excinuclease ABC subunit C [bacterium]